MGIAAGSKLGPYEIIDLLGVGGMGEVWRARDTRLDREVAIKVLPPGFAENEQLLERFEREAKAISQLNHPSVCTLFDVGKEESDERTPHHYLVMEYLEGESLAERIKKGPLPLRDVLKFGQQIASALDAAHREGITHRDLKPGNVMLTKSGAKLLDFGLAKTAAEGQTPIDGLTNMTTEAKPLTTQGTILGTFQYMAPEQLEGLEADARTDIFALGSVLYEMATGCRAFRAESKTSLIAAIVSSQPEPISSVTSVTPPALDRLVRKCLEKDRDDRWQSASDIASELEWISEAGSAAGVAVPVSKRTRGIAWIGWVAAAVIAVGWLGTTLMKSPIPRARIETAIVAPEGVVLDSSNGCIALSPDGSALAFIGHRAGEKRLIWIRGIGSSSVRALAGTEDASHLFWSPDGLSIAFVANRRLSRIATEGGSPESITEGDITGGTWSPGGEIVYTQRRSIYRVAASGGKGAKIIGIPNRTLKYPKILPDGRRFLFTSMLGGHMADALYVGSLDGAEPKIIMEGVYANATFVAPDLVLYSKDGDLRAQRVDSTTLAPLADPVRIADRVQYDPHVQYAFFSVAENGALAYVVGEGAGKSTLAWVSRDGKDVQVVAPAAMYYSPRLSHDEKRIAVDLSGAHTASGDIWIFDLQRNTSTRLTYDPANESAPVWASDDRKVIFFSEKKSLPGIYERSAAGIGNDEVLLEDWVSFVVPTDLSPDGKWLALQVRERGDSTPDIWLLDRESGKTSPLLTSPFSEGGLTFSPDGKWVAYTSDESGQREIYVLQFPESSGKWIVSRGGGDQATWSADGRQIYYLSTDGKLMSVAVTLGTPFDSASPVELFASQARAIEDFPQYSVSQDGSRFLVNRMVGVEDARQVTFVQNWKTSVGR